MTTPARHCAHLLIQGTTEEVHREMLAILQGMYEQEIPSPAGLRAMAAELVKLPVREMEPEDAAERFGFGGYLQAAIAKRERRWHNLTTVAPLERWKP